jgi:predicted amidohydrolase YtcJ
LEEALRMYTVDAAYCSGEENLKGIIEEGKVADLTVLSDDPFTSAVEKIRDIGVQLTVINGKVVFSQSLNR